MGSVPVRIKEHIKSVLRNDAGDVDTTLGSVDTPVLEVDGSRVYVQPTEPSGAAEGDVWIDTSTS